jgi:hypothetical protein
MADLPAAKRHRIRNVLENGERVRRVDILDREVAFWRVDSFGQQRLYRVVEVLPRTSDCPCDKIGRTPSQSRPAKASPNRFGRSKVDLQKSRVGRSASFPA